jgi:hypothetical protein
LAAFSRMSWMNVLPIVYSLGLLKMVLYRRGVGPVNPVPALTFPLFGGKMDARKFLRSER